MIMIVTDLPNRIKITNTHIMFYNKCQTFIISLSRTVNM